MGYNSKMSNGNIDIMFIICDPWPINYNQAFVSGVAVDTTGQEYEAKYDWIEDGANIKRRSF